MAAKVVKKGDRWEVVKQEKFEEVIG